MNSDTIRKLLCSKDKDDILIGMEFLKERGATTIEDLQNELYRLFDMIFISHDLGKLYWHVGNSSYRMVKVSDIFS